MGDLASELREVAITLPDGAVRRYPAGTTGAAVAADISKSLGKAALAVIVDGRLADLSQPIERDAPLAIVTARDERGARAHPPRLRPHHGPRRAGALARDQGDDRPGDRERLVLRLRPRRALHPRRPREDRGAHARRSSPPATPSAGRSGTATAPSATTRRRTSPSRWSCVEAIPDAEPIRMYWHGPWQDLCRGPHLANTGQVPADAFKLMSIAGAYWRGNSRRPMLQRIYGVAFRTAADLDAYLHQLEEAAKRDHRKLAREMDLFHLQPEAQGSVFWHPNGFTLWRVLEAYIRRRLDADGYVEVKTPQLLDVEALAAVRPLGQVPREHVRGARRDPVGRGRGRRPGALGQGRPDGAEADELPRPHPDLQAGHQVLPRPAAPHGRVRLLPPQRGARRAARADARAADDPGRRAHLLPRGPDLRRDQALPRALRPGLRRHGHDRHRLQARDPARRRAPATTPPGTAPRTALADALRAAGLDVRLSRRARARSTARSSSST